MIGMGREEKFAGRSITFNTGFPPNLAKDVCCLVFCDERLHREIGTMDHAYFPLQAYPYCQFDCFSNIQLSMGRTPAESVAE
jgi:hypothetical protein